MKNENFRTSFMTALQRSLFNMHIGPKIYLFGFLVVFLVCVDAFWPFIPEGNSNHLMVLGINMLIGGVIITKIDGR